jgi:hypothetical protein
MVTWKTINQSCIIISVILFFNYSHNCSELQFNFSVELSVNLKLRSAVLEVQCIYLKYSVFTFSSLLSLVYQS